MRNIKLTGREMTVFRCMGFATGAPGAELLEGTRLNADDLVSVLNGLIEAGFVETTPPRESVSAEELAEVNFEVNPAYAQQLREAMMRGR